MVFICFFALLFFQLCYSKQLYALKDYEAYYDKLQLTMGDSEKCEKLTPVSEEKLKYYTLKFMTFDSQNGFVYTIALKPNETHPGGPHFAHLVAFDEKGKIIKDRDLKEIPPAYLGMEPYGIEINEENGEVVILSPGLDDDKYHIFTYNLKEDTLKDVAELFPSKGLMIHANTFIQSSKTLVIAFQDDVLYYDMNGKKISQVKNEYDVNTLDWSKKDGKIYGVGIDPSEERRCHGNSTLVAIDENMNFEVINCIGKGYPEIITGSSTLDYNDGILYAFIGDYDAHSDSYHLMGLDIENAKIISDCFLEEIGCDCCRAVLYSPNI